MITDKKTYERDKKETKTIAKRIKMKIERPKGFKEGKCKCGQEYWYIGRNFGLCTSCIDKLEEPNKCPKHPDAVQTSESCWDCDDESKEDKNYYD